MLCYRHHMYKIHLENQYLHMTVGEVLSEKIRQAGINIASLSEKTGIAKPSIYGILEDERSITPYIALNLYKVLDLRPEEWLAIQARYDLCRERFIEEEKLTRDIGKMMFHKNRRKLIRIAATTDRQGNLL
jgi:addiction module HigA family antidote